MLHIVSPRDLARGRGGRPAGTKCRVGSDPTVLRKHQHQTSINTDINIKIVKLWRTCAIDCCVPFDHTDSAARQVSDSSFPRGLEDSCPRGNFGMTSPPSASFWYEWVRASIVFTCRQIDNIQRREHRSLYSAAFGLVRLEVGPRFVGHVPWTNEWNPSSFSEQHK